MAEDAQIRLENFQSLWNRNGWTPTLLKQRCGASVSMWSDLYHGRKAFGEKLARKIEAGMELDRGSLDEARRQLGVAERPAAYKVRQSRSLDDLLQQLSAVLAEIPAPQREAAATALAGWAREGGADHWRAMFVAACQKQRRTGT